MHTQLNIISEKKFQEICGHQCSLKNVCQKVSAGMTQVGQPRVTSRSADQPLPCTPEIWGKTANTLQYGTPGSCFRSQYPRHFDVTCSPVTRCAPVQSFSNYGACLGLTLVTRPISLSNTLFIQALLPKKSKQCDSGNFLKLRLDVFKADFTPELFHAF